MDTPSSCRERRLSNNKEETQWRNTPTIPTAHGKNRPLLLYYDDRRDDRREYGRPRAAVGFEYDDIIFETRGDADLVLDQLESAIAKYEVASVADLYDLAGVTCRNYTANRYGWSDIQSAKVVRTSEGYVIRLPRAVQIN